MNLEKINNEISSKMNQDTSSLYFQPNSLNRDIKIEGTSKKEGSLLPNILLNELSGSSPINYR